jgi:arylsulfatase A-like enzyme
MDSAVPGERNVVFLVLDSLRKDRLSVYNDDVDFTEHIGALAESATVFQNATAQAPWTLPSHASMFTGEYPWEHGTTHARSYFDGRETFISEFTDAGYATAAITPNIWLTPHKRMTGDFDRVENFLGTADNTLSVRASQIGAKLYHRIGERTRRVLGRQLDRVFRLFSVDDSCKSEETVAAVEEYLGERSPDENFFLFVNLMEPHEPYHPPKRYIDAHGVDESAAIPHRQKDVFTIDDIDYEELRKVYDASVDYTDDLVGRIRSALSDNGLADDTVVVLLSDHGQALGEDGGQFGHQFTVMDPVVDTVLMVSHPDHDGGSEEELVELRSLHDLVPYYAGIGDSPEDLATETVMGGLEFPENFTGYIPKAQWDDYYRKFRFAKDEETKVVKAVQEDGTEQYTAYDLETGAEIEVPPDLKAAVNGASEVDLDDAAEGVDDPEPDEELEQRLEDLGYK